MVKKAKFRQNNGVARFKAGDAVFSRSPDPGHVDLADILRSSVNTKSREAEEHMAKWIFHSGLPQVSQAPERGRVWVHPLIRAAIIMLLASAISSASPPVDVELDPFDFVLGGYRMHVGYTHNAIRYDFGVVSVKIPELIHGNDKFEYEIFGWVARVDYLFDSYQKWFVGLEGTWMENTYTHTPTKASETRRPFLMATRIGYRFVFMDHLTVTPWVGVGALLNKGNDYVVIDSDKFEVSTFNIFPTVHVGWAF